MKPLKRLKWYKMHCEKKDFSRSKVYTWTSQPARLNSSFPRIASHSVPLAPASQLVSQVTLRKWEWAARDQSYMCNQAAAFSCCLTKIKESMGNQLKVIQSVTSKGKSSSKLHQAADELDYLVTFNWSIAQAMAHTMQDLSDGVFINMANLTLARRDSYLEFLKAGIKLDTLMSLRIAPIDLSAYFRITLYPRQKRRYGTVKTNVLPVPPTGNLNATTLIVRLLDCSKILPGSPVHLHGSKSEGMVRGLTGARVHLTLDDRSEAV